MTELLDAIWHQNALLGELLLYQEQTSLATHLQAEWARPMTNYLGRIARAMEVRNEERGSGSGASGSGSGKKKGKGKEKEQEEKAKNRSGNGDGDGDRNEDGDKDADREQDAEGDEMMGKSL
jgi:hypothetical protein